VVLEEDGNSKEKAEISMAYCSSNYYLVLCIFNDSISQINDDCKRRLLFKKQLGPSESYGPLLLVHGCNQCR